LSFYINKTLISENTKPYFIADIAANHDGKLERAKRLIELAAKSGANAAKFQHFRAEQIVSDYGFKELGLKLAHQTQWSKSVFEVYKNASLPWEWTPILKKTADDCGIDFFTATYDLDAIDHVSEYVCAFKIGSGDINWLESISKMIQKKKPIIIATGASTLEEVLQTYTLLNKENVEFAIMQCNTNYSGQLSNIKFSNLKVLLQFKRLFSNTILGLSDHTPGDVTVLGAISFGARLIEKHFTDDNKRQGPDHKFSMNPRSWKNMVLRSHLLFESFGDGIKRVEENEIDSRIIQRRAIRFNRNLIAGQILTRSDISILRPAPNHSITPDKVDQVVGKKLVNNVRKDQLVSFEDIENDNIKA
jgi:N-acetylneuraminate synthase